MNTIRSATPSRGLCIAVFSCLSSALAMTKPNHSRERRYRYLDYKLCPEVIAEAIQIHHQMSSSQCIKPISCRSKILKMAFEEVEEYRGFLLTRNHWHHIAEEQITNIPLSHLHEFHFISFHLKLFIHEKNPSALNIKNLLTNLNLEIKFLKSLKSYIPNLLLFQGVVF